MEPSADAEIESASSQVLGTLESDIQGICLIDQLPDDVFLEIFSYIDAFDAMELSTVSRRCRELCHSRQYLDFDVVKFEANHAPQAYKEVETADAFVESVKNFINYVLDSGGATTIIRLRLCLPDWLDYDEVEIPRWISCAANRNVQELALSCRCHETFELPSSVVTCETLQVLRLHLYQTVLQLPTGPGFQRLQCLQLDHVVLRDRDLTRNLIAGCPKLETLILRGCELAGDMNILDICTPSIKHLAVLCNAYYVENKAGGYGETEVMISWPNLLTFVYGALPLIYGRINIHCLEDLCLHPLIGCETVSNEELGQYLFGVLKEAHYLVAMKLRLATIRGHRWVVDALKRCTPTFRRLKILNLRIRVDKAFMEVLMLFLKHSPNLEAITLHSVVMTPEQEERLKPPDDTTCTCLKSHLKVVQLIDFKGKENEIELARFFLCCGLVLEKLDVFWASKAEMSEGISDLILSFSKSSSLAEVTFHDP